jgi:TP901 family phage tail tape measure protein
MQQARTQMDATNRSAQRTSKAIDKIHSASLGFATAVGAVFAVSIGTAANFEQKMKDVEAVSGESAENMQKLTDLALDMGKKTAFSAAEAANGIEELVKAGVSVTDILNGGLEGALNLATAGNLQLGEAAEIASTALNAFKKDALTVSQAADILAGAANASATDVHELRYGLSMVSAVASGVGLSFKDTTTALATFAQNGLKGSDAGTSLKTMLLNLIPQTKKEAKLFDQLGVTVDGASNAFFDSQGNIKSLAEIAQVLQDKLKGLTNEQRQATLAQMFGTDAIRAGNILYKEGAKGINDMAAALSKVKAADVAKVKLDSLKGAFTELTSSLESVGISIGMEFLPALTQITRQATSFVNSIDEVSMANIQGALAFAGTASAVALLATSIVKVVGALRILSASPLGLAITGVSLLAGVVMGAVVQQNKLNEVSLKAADSMMEQHDALQSNISQYDQLRAKASLSNEELSRFVDINSLISKTADPNVIKRLRDEQEQLRQKSGLSNDEMQRLIDLNDKIIEVVPNANTTLTNQGNILLNNTDAAKKYNAEQLEMLRLELESQKAKAEASMEKNLVKEKTLLKEMKGLKTEMKDIDAAEIEQRRIVAGIETDLATAKANNDKSEINRLQFNLATEKQKLQVIRDQRAKQAELVLEKQKEVDKVQTQIGKLDEVKRKMVDLEMRQAGLNAKRGQEIATIDTAIAKLKQQKTELEKTVPVNQRNTQEYREARDAIQSQITSLEGTKSKIIDIIGQAKSMNAELGKSINKSVSVLVNNHTITTETRRIIDPLNKGPIKKDKPGQILGLNYHTGGLVGRGQMPMLHVGGLASQFASSPNHNEVDVRLLRDEMVLTQAQQANLMRMIDAGFTNKGAESKGVSKVYNVKVDATNVDLDEQQLTRYLQRMEALHG